MIYTKTINISNKAAISTFTHCLVKGSLCSKEIFKQPPKMFSKLYAIIEAQIWAEESLIHQIPTHNIAKEVYNIRAESGNIKHNHNRLSKC